MRRLGLGALLLLGCSSVAKPVGPASGGEGSAPVEAGPKDKEAPPADGPVADAPADAPPQAPATDACGGSCKAPEQCITVVGMQPDSARGECWIPCADGKCPKGLTCEMVYDGPGHVCVKPD